MSPTALRSRLRRRRHHTALAALLCALIALIGLHHGAPAIGAAHHDSEIVEVAQMCLGIFTAVGAAVVAGGLAPIAFGRQRPAILHHPHGALRTARLPFPRVRAGPILLVLLCVSRR